MRGNSRFKLVAAAISLSKSVEASRPITSLVQNESHLGSNEHPRAEIKSTVTPQQPKSHSDGIITDRNGLNCSSANTYKYS